MREPRWKVISQSEFPWEREALDYLKQNLPDQDPYYAWSNFEFISDDGSINEVDTLILTPQGFFLVEIKSRPGVLNGDAMTWSWTSGGKTHFIDNPLLLANRKSKKLASLLKKFLPRKSTFRLPYLEPLIFCSHQSIQCNLSGVALNRVCVRDNLPPRHQTRGKIISALKNRDFEGALAAPFSTITPHMAREIAKAVEQAGIRPSQRSRRVGDYLLKQLLFESPTGIYQDWEAHHDKLGSTIRRIRIYTVARHLSESDRQTVRRAAAREFQLLDSLSHPAILPVENYTEFELGPALIFRYTPQAMRLDHFFLLSGEQIGIDTRLSMVRQIAEALQYAHHKRVIHRALSPQSILVLNPDDPNPKLQIFNWQTGFKQESSSTGGGNKLFPTQHLDQLVEDGSTVYLAPESEQSPEHLGEHLDIFSLGAVAYFIFSGKPPAESSFELTEKLRESRGLDISSVLDGTVPSLQSLIKLSTHPEVICRPTTVGEFLVFLDVVEEELTRPTEEVIENPLDARAGQRLSGGLEVKCRLGSGGSAVALLVAKAGKEIVLKLASSPDHNERLIGEFDVLKKLRHQNIVEVYDQVTLNGLSR